MAFDRAVKMFDEPHSPDVLDAMRDDKSINKGKFLSRAHAESYLYQMQTIQKLTGVKSILEVGPGEGFCANNLRNLGYQYDTLDFEGAHEPTINADLRTLDPDTIEKKYDLTCGFQVLEHFPYELFARNLKTLASLSTRYVFISLPFSCRGFSLSLNIQNGQHPGRPRRLDFYVATNLPNRVYRPEYRAEFPWAVHYWEIGRRGFGLKRVLGDIEASGLSIKKRFHSPNPYHYFVLCEKK